MEFDSGVGPTCLNSIIQRLRHEGFILLSENMTPVLPSDLNDAIKTVLTKLNGISDLYPHQHQLLQTIIENDNIFYTNSTNSGKTLPTVIFPQIVKHLSHLGYKFPPNPKVLFVTVLNSLKLSLVNNAQALGIECAAVTSDNIQGLLESNVSVLFISPETLKLPSVTKLLLSYRSTFVLKVVDECHLGKLCSKISA